MSDQESNLIITELKHSGWEPFLMRTLIEATKTLQPRANTGRVPTISVARDD